MKQTGAEMRSMGADAGSHSKSKSHRTGSSSAQVSALAQNQPIQAHALDPSEHAQIPVHAPMQDVQPMIDNAPVPVPQVAQPMQDNNPVPALAPAPQVAIPALAPAQQVAIPVPPVARNLVQVAAILGKNGVPIPSDKLASLEAKLVLKSRRPQALADAFTSFSDANNVRLVWGYVRTTCLIDTPQTAELAESHARTGTGSQALKSLIVDMDAKRACNVLSIMADHFAERASINYQTCSDYICTFPSRPDMIDHLRSVFLMPKNRYCTDEYIEQIINGKKRALKHSEVHSQVVPRLMEIKLDDLLKQWGLYPELAIVLPDRRSGIISCDWRFFWDALNTVYPGVSAHLIKQIKNKRKEKLILSSAAPGNPLAAVAGGQLSRQSTKGIPDVYAVYSKSGDCRFKITEAGPQPIVQDDVAKIKAVPDDILNKFH